MKLNNNNNKIYINKNPHVWSKDGVLWRVVSGIFFCGSAFILSLLGLYEWVFLLFLLAGVTFIFLFETSYGFSSVQDGSRAFSVLLLAGILFVFSLNFVFQKSYYFEFGWYLPIPLYKFFIYTMMVILLILMIVSNSKEVKVVSNLHVYLVLVAYLLLSLLDISKNFIIIYSLIEISSMIFYGVIASTLKTQGGAESVTKYFLMSAYAGVCLALGFILIYLDLGSFEVNQFIDAVGFNTVIGGGFVVIALSVKLGVIPFHMWVIDLYKVSSFQIIMFLLLVPKIAYLYVLFVFLTSFPVVYVMLSKIIGLFGICGIIISTIQIATASDFRSFYANSTLNMLGFVYFILGFVPKGGVIFFMVFSYVITSVILLYLVNVLYSGETPMQKKRSIWDVFFMLPGLGVVLLIVIFSNIGLPPFVGFFSKFYGFASLVEHVWFQGAHVGLFIFSVLFVMFTSFAYFIFLAKTQFSKYNIVRLWFKLNSSGVLFITVLLQFVVFFAFISGDVFNFIESMDFIDGIIKKV